MTIVTMLHAKTNLSKLVEAVESGAEDEIIIASNGKPVARLVPLAAKAKIRLGLAEGQYDAAVFDDWDAPTGAWNNWLEDSIARDERTIAAAQARLIAANEANMDDDAPAA